MRGANRWIDVWALVVLGLLAACPGGAAAVERRRMDRRSSDDRPASDGAVAAGRIHMVPLPTRWATLEASPNPIMVCDGSGYGVTTLSWSATGVKEVQVHVHRPDGPQTTTGTPVGSADTGKWVADGTTFLLQDISDGLPLSAEHTLATVTVRVTNEGCPPAVAAPAASEPAATPAKPRLRW